MAKGNPPDAKFRIGFVTASVWKNDSGFYSVTLQRSYKEDGEMIVNKRGERAG